jgi:hypothetical protein
MSDRQGRENCIFFFFFKENDKGTTLSQLWPNFSLKFFLKKEIAYGRERERALN